MKKVIIGLTLALCGTIIDCAIIIGASAYCASLNSWAGSKFWYAVFGATRYGNEVNLSLNLGLPFVFGGILILIGLVVLAIEYFNKSK
jgi:hypothetical protein